MSGGRPWLAMALLVLTAALIAVGVAAAIATPGSSVDSQGWGTLLFVPPVAAFSIVGGLISLRRPGNAIGGLLEAIGALFALVVACSNVSAWALRTGSLPHATGEWISVGSNAWVVALGLAGTQLPLRLPDGRLPSDRWRWFSRATIVLIAVALVGMGAQQGRANDEVPGTSNPLGAAWAEPLAAAFGLVILSFAGGLAALVLRYRRAGAHDRVQLRWVAFGGAAFLAIYLIMGVTQSLAGADTTTSIIITGLAQLAFGALPVAIGYAVLRQNLYDIDVVINRTLVYGALTATLAATYLGSVLLLQFALSGLTGDSGLAVAGSTLAVAALFRPARARIQQVVDRRFFRRKYDAQRTLEAFAARLRDEVALDALSSELRAVVAETMQPRHVSLWLRER